MARKITVQRAIAANLAFVVTAYPVAPAVAEVPLTELCQASSAIIPKAIQLHKENASMLTAEKLVDSVPPYNDRLRAFLIESIHVDFLHSEYILNLVETGEWQRQCIAY